MNIPKKKLENFWKSDDVKKFGIYILLIISFMFIGNVRALENNVDLYLFHSSTCPHCKEERIYLKDLEKKYDFLNIHYYEVSEDALITSKVKDKLNIKESYVPITVVGSDYIIGFSSVTKSSIEDLIDKYHKNNGCDAVNKILKGEDIKDCLATNKKIKLENDIKEVPLIGKVNIKKASLPLISIVIGLVDGFNPCAMWVLIFLITMLINLKNRKRMWILGFSFIIASALVYLLFMLAYLNIATLIQNWFKYIIALVAFIGGIFNLYSYFKSLKKDVGCTVTNVNQRRKITNKIRKILSEKNFFFAIIGIILLAISVNFVELLCSAGLPVLFIQILSMNNLNALQSGIYIFIYLLFFMLDDIIIFTIAMISFKVTGISNKYSKYSHLIGGIIMLLIGLLLVLKPEWLMFNF